MVLNEHMTPSLARAARAILNWSMTDLAQRTGVAATTIRNYESGKRGTTRVNRATIAAAFREEGIEFIGGEQSRPGLVLTRPELLNNPPPQRIYRSR
jgi:transcriptional regulator with XRE-family HTH domain